MRVSVRNSLLGGLLLLSSPGLAGGTQGIYLPSAPQGPGGEDVVETSSGARCRQSMNNNGGYLDIGLTANTSKPSTPPTGSLGPILYNYNNNDGDQALGYARVTIPLGHRPARLDCSRMYELEIARMKREIEMLKLAAE
jgi:hypothetical protein